ncbi:MAG: zinc ribbon domain-containing protein [Planctomycetaceae bacterium]|nr:zinc ribbon domain-containing protein [Planctomycetaceae bacterium]
MQPSTDLSIPIESLVALKRYAFGTPNLLSPLDRFDAPDDEGIPLSGLTDADGNLRTEGRRILEVLTAPRSLATLASTDGHSATSHTVYFAADDTPGVLVSTVADALRFRQPAPVESIIGGLEQIIGRSVMGGDDDDDDGSSIIELSTEPGLVFAAALDLQRSSQLAQIANDSKAPVLLTPESVKAQFGRGAEHPQWLVNSLSEFTDQTDHRSIDFEASLSGLAQRGLCTEVAGGFIFGDVGQQLSSRTLLLRWMFNVILAKLTPDGTASSLQIRAHYFGNNEVLLVTRSASTLTFAVRSTACFLAVIEAALKDPDSFPDFASSAPESFGPPAKDIELQVSKNSASVESESSSAAGVSHRASTTRSRTSVTGSAYATSQPANPHETTTNADVPGSLTCRKCGNYLRQGSKFCSHCGTRSALTACPVCRHKVADTDRFCEDCGCGLYAVAAKSPTQPSVKQDRARQAIGKPKLDSTDQTERPGLIVAPFPKKLPVILIILSALYSAASLWLCLIFSSETVGDMFFFQMLLIVVALYDGLIFCLSSLALANRSKGLLHYAAILACVPILSPGIVIGIPVGIGILVRLNRS